MGSEAELVNGKSNSIAFSAGSKAVTRATQTGDAAATLLTNKFFTYGVKTVGGAESVVFPSYAVLYNGTGGAGASGSTISNTAGWEYVGLTDYASQSVHYWDYAASNYTFQAWSTTDGSASVEATSKNTLKVTGTAANLAKLYIADLVSIDKSTSTSGVNQYGGVVTFTFRNGASKVRFGMYETIAGYKLSNVTFRSAATPTNFSSSTTNAILDGSFTGDNETEATYTVTYDASNKAVLSNTASAAATKFMDFGTFTDGNISESASTPTYAGGGYQTVLPNENLTGDMTLYVDFTLTAENGTDVLNVKGAQVTVPASSMVWKPNFAYTYLFNVTKNMNGTTGTEGPDPTKLYPITFDAIVEDAAADGGTVTTVLN